ncbi:MAG TPA: DUF3311 domain-containing protein [Acidimicrobiales bacterium]|nr:DUF3311 domain-containing protein [Acidimicrobiales bacterium]
MVTGSGHLRSRPPKLVEAPVSYVASALLLAAAFVALLWVPTYAHLTPSIGGLPFFYWYSMLWLVINAACQLIAYYLLVTLPRRRRSPATEGGRP